MIDTRILVNSTGLAQAGFISYFRIINMDITKMFSNVFFYVVCVP